MTRLFREGRTETVRSCTNESSAFVRALENGEVLSNGLIYLKWNMILNFWGGKKMSEVKSSDLFSVYFTYSRCFVSGFQEKFPF